MKHQKHEDWLGLIAEHPDTSEADYAMAEEILSDSQLTVEQRNRAELKRLEDLRFLFVDPGGRWEPVYRRG